ncbi:hypothetical protein [Herbidospora sp. NBRC 101105]|uniref:hypothetical protein n=1 Tax=Herbidospora sp. NBRC 101105 TaxID=3032195 RepID=UPI0024A3A74B|nr:hypothetical protein [Herbidospora sp. NBRC 101105]GLX99510.1 hypothetical protein Hesp01_74600 [Herbidospora sp. NBRC 101105]
MPSGAGDRTDILVEALPETHREFPEAGEPLKLVIEVKCAGNKNLKTAQEKQLVDRYLKEARTDVGIYLVGWHPVKLWTTRDNAYRIRAKKLRPDTLQADLDQQAAQLSRSRGVHVRSLVITVPRPHKHT